MYNTGYMKFVSGLIKALQMFNVWFGNSWFSITWPKWLTQHWHSWWENLGWLFFNLLGVTLSNKVIQISSVQFYLYYIICIVHYVFTILGEISSVTIFDSFYPFLPPTSPLFLW